MPYDIKVAIKKVTAKPSAFALIEGKKSHMMVFVPTTAIMTEVQQSCGQGKVAAKGLCHLEGKMIVFRTKAPPQTTWTSHLKQVFLTTKCPVSPFEFRQLGEGESDEVESPGTEGSESGDGKGNGGTVPKTSTARPVIGQSRIPGNTATPVRPQSWGTAKPSPGVQRSDVTIGTPQPTVTPQTTGTVKPTTEKPLPSTPSPSSLQKSEFDKRFKSILPLYQKKLPTASLEEQKEIFFKQAGAKALEKDWKGAHEALDSLEMLVGSGEPQDSNLAEGVEDLHQRTGLQKAAISRNTASAKETATRLINSEGKIGEDFDKLLKEVGDLPDSPYRKQLSKMLNRLKTDKTLSETITSIPKPDKKNPINGFIRATLGLKKDEEVTEVHARQAAMSALLAEIRQHDVGSCFGTAIAIRVHDEQPERFLKDIAEMMKTGKLERTVDGKKIEIPINSKMSTRQVDQMIKLKRSDPKVGKDVALHEAPGFVAGLGALGIEANKCKEAFDAALLDLRDSKETKIKNAIAAVKVNGKTKRVALDSKARKEFERKAMEALREAPDSTIEELIAKIGLDGEQINEAKGAYGKYDTAESDLVTPTEVLRRVAMKRNNLTEKDLLNRERQQVLAAQVRARVGDTSKEAQKLFSEYERLTDALHVKAADFEKLDEELDAARESYLGLQDNRLLRAWEYSVGTMAEKGTAPRQKARLKDTTCSAVNEQLVKIVNKVSGGIGTKKEDMLLDATLDLQNKFKALFEAQIQTGYDPSAQGELSEDGASDRGAFTLYDTTGATNSDDWIKIGDERGYADMVSGLMMQAWHEVYGKSKDDTMKEHARLLADELAEAARTGEFMKAVKEKTKEEFKTEQKPWEAVVGNLSENLLPVYYEKDKPEIEEEKPVDSTQLLNFLVKNAKSMWGEIKDGVEKNPEGATVPMSGGPHSFNLRPGSPALKQALESDKDPGEWISTKIEAEKEKAKGQRETKLTPAIKASLFDSLFEGFPTGLRDFLEGKVNEKCKDGGTIDELNQAIQAECTTPEKKAEMGHKVALAMTQLVLPPVDADKVEATIEKCLKSLNLSEENQKTVLVKVKEAVLKEGVKSASMAELEKAVATVLKSENIETDEAEAAKKVNQALRKSIEPPGIVFADTNWGGGDHHTVFSMVTNPITDVLELWQMAEDGSSPKKLDEKTWVTSTWKMPKSPDSFGGV
jgi:hypothetical protein